MTDVKISPNAAAIHVEGDIGGGGGNPVITVVRSTLVTPVEEIVSMYNNHIIPSAIVVKNEEDDMYPYIYPVTYFYVNPSEDSPTFTVQANDLSYLWDTGTPYLSYHNVTVTNYEDFTYLETPEVKTVDYYVKNLDYPD